MNLKLSFNVLGLLSLIFFILLLVLETTLLIAGSIGTLAVYIWRHFWFVACQHKDKD